MNSIELLVCNQIVVFLNTRLHSFTLFSFHCSFFLLFFPQVGYGNAAGCLIFLTSYLGVAVFRRWVSDETLILIGMLSFASGIYFMTFATTTAIFYAGKNKWVLLKEISLGTMRPEVCT